MTVMMHRSQYCGRRGQRIDTSKPERGIVLLNLYDGGNKARRFLSWQENLMVFSRFLSLCSPR